MKIKYIYSRHFVEKESDCETLEDAVNRAIYDLENETAWPLEILIDGKLVWENPGISSGIENSLIKFLNKNELS